METDVRAFCSSMRDELTGWKARTYDLIRKTEEMSPGPGRKVKASINDMKTMIGRIDHTIAELETRCPVSWHTEKSEVEQAMCDIRARWDDASAMSPDDFE